MKRELIENIDKVHTTDMRVDRIRRNLGLGDIDVVEWCRSKILNEHPQIAKEYETLKLELWKQYEHDRDAYTDAKTDFIRKWTEEARKVYGDRYCML